MNHSFCHESQNQRLTIKLNGNVTVTTLEEITKAIITSSKQGLNSILVIHGDTDTSLELEDVEAFAATVGPTLSTLQARVAVVSNKDHPILTILRSMIFNENVKVGEFADEEAAEQWFSREF